MGKIFLIIIALQLGFFFQGCATLKHLDGSSEKEIKIFKLNKKKMYKDLQRYEVENEILKRQVNTLRKEYDRLQEEKKTEVAVIIDKKEPVAEQINEPTVKVQEEDQDTKALANKLTTDKVANEDSLDETSKLTEKLGELKIKVLTGDGHLDSAKMMAKKLRTIGCSIKRIDYAPRSNFLKTTVYFSPEFQNEAKYLSSCLGIGTVNQPLSWSSIFDIIVVTGKTI